MGCLKILIMFAGLGMAMLALAGKIFFEAMAAPPETMEYINNVLLAGLALGLVITFLGGKIR